MTKKIAVISEHASPRAHLGSVDNGGQNIYVRQVAKHIAAAGYQVDVFTRRDHPDLPEILEWENGVRIVHVPAGPAEFVRKEDLLGYMQEFTDYMIQFCSRAEDSYDLVHANFWMSGLVAADLKRALGIPFVITFHALGRVRRLHQGKADGFPEDRFQIEDRIVSEADKIIAECPQDEADLIHLYRADPARITIVPCGFDPEELWPLDKTLSRRVLRLPLDEKIILQLGRLVPRKGVETAVRGFARLVRDYGVPARLIIVGGESDDPDPELTPEIGRLQAVAAEERVADRVIFTGRRGREALKHYFSAADVFVSTPWYEPFGITPVEAMACSTPVIGSSVGGIKYTVVDGETGYLVPPKDPQALGERLAQLLQNPDLLERFSQKAVERANELFTWEKVAKSIAGVYEQVLAACHPAARIDIDPATMIEQGFDDALEALQLSRQALPASILEIAQAVTRCIEKGGRVYVCGNGGSAADAQHFAAEFVGQFKVNDRRALPVIALNTDTAFLTAWSNDIGYESIFSRQIEAYGQPGDLLIGISTSGRSKNLVNAFETARENGLVCIGILGGDGGELLPLSNLAIVVPVLDTARIQEIHMLALHLVCELVEGHFLAEQFLSSDSLLATSTSRVPSLWSLQPSEPVRVTVEKTTNIDGLIVGLEDPAPVSHKENGSVVNNNSNKKKGR